MTPNREFLVIDGKVVGYDKDPRNNPKWQSRAKAHARNLRYISEHPDILTPYPEEYVAVHDRSVIEHHKDLQELDERLKIRGDFVYNVAAVMLVPPIDPMNDFLIVGETTA